MENTIEKYAGYLPAKVDLNALTTLDKTAEDFAALVAMNTGSPSAIVLRAEAMDALRRMLTDELMAPVMALQGSKIGFLTDRDKIRDERTGQWLPGKGYDMRTVRDVTIWAFGNGARMTGNEVNILAGGGYLTRNFFQRRNDERLGAENWWARAAVPSRIFGKDGKCLGANVSGELYWKDAAGEHKQTLIRTIKGDNWASADSFVGKWERKAFKMIYEFTSHVRVDDGELDDDAIPTTAVPVEEGRGIFGGERAPMPRSGTGAAAATNTPPETQPAPEGAKNDDPAVWLRQEIGPECPVGPDDILEYARSVQVTVTRENWRALVSPTIDWLDAQEAVR